ncbi:MAG: hypothetical protein QM608_08090 [Caulobacter sp.]
MDEKNSSTRTRHKLSIEQAQLEFNELIKSLARITAHASHKLGIRFDMSDPQVARELIIITFDAIVQGPRKERRVSHGRKSRVPVLPSKPPENALEMVARQRSKPRGKA